MERGRNGRVTVASIEANDMRGDIPWLDWAMWYKSHAKRDGWHVTIDARDEAFAEAVYEDSKKRKRLNEYKNYLRSPGYRKKRADIIVSRGSKCERCGSTENLCLHHKKILLQFLRRRSNSGTTPRKVWQDYVGMIHYDLEGLYLVGT